ncbi:MAG: hypothetical protein WBD17_05365, partial [Candidatus Omnitrophota bacterium]
EESIRRTIDFAIELDPDIAKFHILKPYPGTEVYGELLEKGMIDDMDFSHYGIHTGPVHHLESLTAKDIMRLQNEAYRRFYMRPSKLAKQVIRMNSLTRVKLNVRVGFSLLRKMFEKQV